MKKYVCKVHTYNVLEVILVVFSQGNAKQTCK